MFDLGVLEITAIGLGIAVVLYALYWYSRSQNAHPIIDETSLEAASGYTAKDGSLDVFIGEVGKVLTDMRPVGFVEFHGRRVECVSNAGWIAKDAYAKAIRYDGPTIVVEPTLKPI